LHDIIEKSNGSIDEDQLKNDFGEHVYNMVHAVTRPKIKNEVREKVLDEYFHNIATGSRFIRYIKLADRLDNIRALKNALHKDKLMRYKEETQKYILPIAEKTDEKIVFKLSVALYELK